MEPSRPRFAALALTHDCNLRCTYCYAGPKSRRPMSRAVAFRSLEFLHEASGGSCTITLFGGEPLLEFDLLRDLVATGRERYGAALRFRMSTNGTLLDRERLEYLKANDVGFVLSIDGNEAQHDRCRRLTGGGGSYAVVAAKLDDVLRLNPYTVAVSVITPETAGDLAQGVEDLFARGFRYVMQTLDHAAPWRRQDLETLARGYRSLAAFYHRTLRDGQAIYYSPFDERIRTRARRAYTAGDLCDLAATHVAIAPSGRIYPCVQFTGADGPAEAAWAIGDVFTGFDDARRRELVEENHAGRPTCTGCALEGRCATWCGCVNWRSTGSIRIPPALICEHERMLMPIVDRVANRLWKERNPVFRQKFYGPPLAISSWIDDCMRGARAPRGEA